MSKTLWISSCASLFLLVVGFFIFRPRQETHDPNPAYSMARVMTLGDQNLEIVDRDDHKQTVTLRNKRTNQSKTFGIDQLERGTFSWENDRGTVEILPEGAVWTGKDGEKLVFGADVVDHPNWVPEYPNGSATGITASSSMKNDSGQFIVQTQDTWSQVADWYRQTLQQAGFEFQNDQDDPKARQSFLHATLDDEGKSLNISIEGRGTAPTRVTVIYSHSK